MKVLTLWLFCALYGMGAALGTAVRRLHLQERSMEEAAMPWTTRPKGIAF